LLDELREDPFDHLCRGRTHPRAAATGECNSDTTHTDAALRLPLSFVILGGQTIALSSTS
jgi:hypothetical protein